jgi:hypothetical protein
MTGIITLPLVPLRESESEISEMFTQLLFGELVEVLEVHERWISVRNLTDGYTGWADRKMIKVLTETEGNMLLNADKYCVTVPFLLCDKTISDEKMFLPGGSFLPSLKKGRFEIGNEIYQISVPFNSKLKEILSEKIVNYAFQYLNAPYLWGGKSIMGIDCSGLVQVVYAMCDILLPRDASQQVEMGRVIDFLFEAEAGDLAFFENAEGSIIHVGILLNTRQIIHASGSVKLESIDSQGIISSQTGEYTHTLRVIKRVI